MADLLGTADLDLFRSIFETLPDCPFFVKNSELRYVAANRAMARMCGVVRAAELHGHRADRFFPAALAFRYEALDRQVLETGLPIRHRLHRSVGSGEEPVWLLFSRTPIFDRIGNTVGVIASARRLNEAGDDGSIYHRLTRVAERMDNEFDRPLRVRELASLSGVSVSQLERDFMRLFGMTLGQYLHHVRISHALLRLDEGLSISTVAYECGYTDHSAFTRRFRKVLGLSPREYRSSSSSASQ